MFNDNSTRLAYRKICRRVILFYNGMANKKSRSIEEQIELLKQRGMIVGDEIFAARHLAHISYYRLKGYWWDMQYDKTRHLFQPDSNLEDVVTRYYFDKELRLILFDAIETIEITLRTKMIYHLSQSYGGSGIVTRSCSRMPLSMPSTSKTDGRVPAEQRDIREGLQA